MLEALSFEFPEGAAFFPINVVLERRNTSRIGRPLLVLVDETNREDLAKFKWVTASTVKDAHSGHVYRRITGPHLVIPDGPNKGSRFFIREGLASRVLGIHETADPRVAYRNGDRLDCRLANLIPHAECSARGVDPDLMVSPGSTFSHFPQYRQGLADRSARYNELLAAFPGGRKACLAASDLRGLLEEMLADPDYYRGKPYSWYTTEGPFAEPAGHLSDASIRAILHGKQQRLPGFDYEALSKLLPQGRMEKRKARINIHLQG